MGFIILALKNLLRHKIRNFLTILGISASIATLFSIISFNKGFEANLQKEINRTGLHFMIVPSGCPHEVASLVLHGTVIPKFLNLDVLQKISQYEEFEITTPILVAQIFNSEKGKLDLVYGLEMDHLDKIKPHWKIDGEIPKSDASILVGYEVAKHYSIKKGDVLSYENVKFKVSGIIQKTSSQDDAFVYMPIKSLQRIINKPDSATGIGVRVKRVDKINSIIEELRQKVPGIQIVTMNEIVNSLSNLAASAKILGLSIVVVAITISALGIMNTVLMSIFERTEEIGVMRAIGASKVDIFQIVFFETVLLSLLGGIKGLLISLVFSNIIEGFLRSYMPYIPYGKIIQFDLFLALKCLIFSVFIGIIAGFLPALRALKINPIEAIRG